MAKRAAKTVTTTPATSDVTDVTTPATVAAPADTTTIATPAAADTPAAAGKPRLSLADKVVRHAARLGASPLVPQPGSRYAPAQSVQPGVYLSGDGQLLIAKTGDGWRVSQFQVADGQVTPVGDVTFYPTAQKALIALRTPATAS